MATIDPCIVRQYVPPLKNNYFKTWFALIRLHIVILKSFCIRLKWRIGELLVKPNEMQKLDWMNIIIQLKVHNHWNIHGYVCDSSWHRYWSLFIFIKIPEVCLRTYHSDRVRLNGLWWIVIRESLLSWAFSRQDKMIKINIIITGSVTFK